jgi:hypothetical protein
LPPRAQSGTEIKKPTVNSDGLMDRVKIHTYFSKNYRGGKTALYQ